MTTTLSELDSLTLTVRLETRVRASLEDTFAALLEQLGPGFEAPDGKPMPMQIDPRPGGRWVRDLGDDNGHYWGSVQAIKRPTLLEISGPLFMSYPVSNNVQYRLREEDGETVISFVHSGFGLIQEDHRKNVVTGWGYISQRARERAESKR